MANINDFINNLVNKNKSSSAGKQSSVFSQAQSMGQKNNPFNLIQSKPQANNSQNGATNTNQTNIRTNQPSTQYNEANVQKIISDRATAPVTTAPKVQNTNAQTNNFASQDPRQQFTETLFNNQRTTQQPQQAPQTAQPEQPKEDPYLKYLDSLFNVDKLNQAQSNIDQLNQRTANELLRTRATEDKLRANEQGQLAFGQSSDLATNERESNKSLADLAIAKGAQTDIYNQMINAGATAYEARQAAQAGADGFTLGKDQVRYDAQGNVIAGNTGGQQGGIQSGVASNWASAIEKGTAKLSDVPQDQRAAVIQAMTQEGKPDVNLARLGDAGIIINKVNDALSSMPKGSTGLPGQLTAWIKSSPAGSLNSIYKTIQAKVGFDELQAMRDASPTGGALGQVSERELEFLSSSIANLDVGLSKEVQAENLGEILDYFQKYQDDQILAYIQQVGEENVTDEDIAMLLEGREPSSFNNVGNTRASTGGNVPQRNKNPGNVKQGGLADELAIGVDNQGHLIFPDEATGFEAMKRDIQAKISGKSRYLPANPTLAQLGKVYAEDPNWANSVARIIGASPNTETSIIPINTLVQAIARQEGYYA